MRLLQHGGWLLCAVVAMPLAAWPNDSTSTAQITRVSATLNGVFSPRGFFNILVPLGQIQGVRATKLDLKKSLITIDFEPGTAVTQQEMRQVMVNAGYKPGVVTMNQLPASQAAETGPGWMTIKHPTAKNPLVRWIQQNF